MPAKFFKHRFGPLAVLAIMVCSLSFVTRVVLMVKSWPALELNSFRVAGIFLIGLLYDVAVWSFFSIPLAFYCWLMKDSWFRKKTQRVVLYLFFFIVSVILVLNAGAEIVFWNEFNVRFNFIAVDYLVYTTEVIENIWESYNIPLIGFAVVITAALIVFLLRKKILASQEPVMRFGRRSVFFGAFLLVPLAGYWLMNNRLKNISNNNYVNELGGNGIYEFGTAFWNNEIDYNRFYATRSDSANISLVRKMLQAPNATFTGDPLSIEREIRNDSPELRHNIVLISVESLSGDYLQHFGNNQKITPFLDSLIPRSLFFENFYASGTRTVRGLEALSLAIPPTPGQSIVRRPGNEDLFALGSVLADRGYEVNFIYGGNSFFDNMGYYFSHNGYRVLDKRDIPDRFVHHTTAWGIDDEGAFDFTLQQCDRSYRSGKLFFNHIMTISNHRPYTYPDGRIDIPSTTQSIEGGVKYTDYAIHKFLTDAAGKPWFSNTLFVVVADHCSKSAGKTDLPVNRYHIPCFIYSPQWVRPAIEYRLTSQVDLAPTLLGLMNLNYSSRFMGYDIYKMPAGRERAFISTYQNMGYLKAGKLVILSPQRLIKTYNTEHDTGQAVLVPNQDELVNEAIAWYQGASFLFRNGRYKMQH